MLCSMLCMVANEKYHQNMKWNEKKKTHTPSILWITLFPPAFCPIRIYQYAAILSYACMSHVQYHHCPFRFSALLQNVLCLSCASRALSSTHWIPAIAVYGCSCCFICDRASMHIVWAALNVSISMQPYFMELLEPHTWHIGPKLFRAMCLVPCARNIQLPILLRYAIDSILCLFMPPSFYTRCESLSC